MSLFTDLREVFTAYAQRIKSLAAADEKIKADLDDQTGIISKKADYYINLTVDPVDINNPSSSSTGLAYAVVDCSEGDKFVINATGATSARAWGFLDGSNHVLSMADANATVTDLKLTAPTNAVKLVINDKGDGMSYKVGTNIASKTVDLVSEIRSDLGDMPTYKELYLAPRIKYALKNVLKNGMFFNQYGGVYLEMLELSLNMSSPTKVNYFTTFSEAYESVYLNNNGTKTWNSNNSGAWRSVPITLGNAKYLEYDGVPSYWRGTSVYVIPAIVFTDDNKNVLQVIDGRDGEFATRYQNKDDPSAQHHDMNTSGFVKIPFGATKAYVSVEHVSSGDYVGTVHLYY